MSKIENIPDLSFLEDAKVVERTPEEEARYKKLVEEADERIRESKRHQAEAWFRARNYVAR